MPDWKKRLNKEQSEAFEPGEKLIAASYFQGRGSTAGSVGFAAAGGGGVGLLVGSAMAKKAKKADNTPEDSIAAQLRHNKGVVAFTDRNIYVFGYKQGMVKPKILDPVAKISRNDLVGWSYKSGKLTGTINFAFADESDVGINIPKANKPDQFAAELAIPAVE